MDEIQYTYPKEILDGYIESMQRGIIPMISEDVMREVKLRMAELKAEITGDDEDFDILKLDIEKQKEAIKRQIEIDRRKASTKDVLIIKLSDEDKHKLRMEMSSSYVRTDPDSRYNIPDDQLYKNEEYASIYNKLAKIQPRYYNPEDWINAVHTITEAINFSLKNDYPWMSKEEALKEFNSGKIHFTWGQGLPKLLLDYTHEVKDPELLKGILNGSVKVIERNKDNKTKEFRELRVRNHNSRGIPYDYRTLTKWEVDYMDEAHKNGWMTPIDGMYNLRPNSYSWSLPSSSILSLFSKNNSNQYKIDNRPFDWSMDYAADKYIDRLHGGSTYTMTNLIEDLNKAAKMNGDELGTMFVDNAKAFEQFLAKCSSGYINSSYAEYTRAENSRREAEYNQKAMETEDRLMNAIRANNPNL